VKAAGDIPVTIKMRKGIDENHLTYLEAGKAAEGSWVLPRLPCTPGQPDQFYSGHADWDAIGELKSSDFGRSCPR
jgi:tRNA-dihydrouridine synthase